MKTALMLVALGAAACGAQDDGERKIGIRPPEADSLDIVIEAAQMFGPYRVAWSGANVRIEIDGVAPFEATADERGVLRLPMHKVLALAKRSGGTIEIRVKIGRAHV